MDNGWVAGIMNTNKIFFARMKGAIFMDNQSSPAVEKSGYCDLLHLVQSIQRAEGSPNCFRTGKSDCQDFFCAWRSYCLEVIEEAPE